VNISNNDSNNNILYSVIDKYNVNLSFSQYVEYYRIYEIISILPILFLSLIYLYFKKDILFNYNDFFFRYSKYISLSILLINNNNDNRVVDYKYNSVFHIRSNPVPKPLKKEDGTWN